MNKPSTKLLGLILTLALTALLTTGCATDTSLYNWGKYEQVLFINYHEPEYKEQAIQQYISFINEQQSSNKTKLLAPGLFAEAGTFMLERGDYKNALVFYKMEYDTWPKAVLC